MLLDEEAEGPAAVLGAAAEVEEMEAVDMTSTRVTSAEVRPDEEDVEVEDEDDSSVTTSRCTWLACPPVLLSCCDEHVVLVVIVVGTTGELLAAESWGHFVAL